MASQDGRFAELLNKFVYEDRDRNAAWLIQQTGIARNTVYEWFGGTRPSKASSVLSIAKVLGLTREETRQLLDAAGYEEHSLIASVPDTSDVVEHSTSEPFPSGFDLTEATGSRGQIEQGLHEMSAILGRVAYQQGYLVEDARDRRREGVPSPPFPLFVGIPSPPDNHPVVGREPLITDITNMLVSDNHRPVALEGMGGIGKSTLAATLAQDTRLLEHFTDGVLWAGLGPQPNGMHQLLIWGKALGEDLVSIPEKERTKKLQQTISDKRLLLIIDDVWDIAAVEPLQCSGPYCRRLFTTRNQEIAIKLAGQDRTITVSELDESSAWTLLESMAPAACQVDPDAAQHLLQRVDGAPLAIELLGGYLCEPERRLFPDMSAEALAELMDPQRRLELVTRRLGTHDDKNTTLAAILALSLEDLPEKTQSAFYALGAFAPKPEVFDRAAALSVADMNGTILSQLLSRNLVQCSRDGYFTLHPLVADLARTVQSPEYEIRHRKYYLDIVNNDKEGWQRIEPVYGQLKWIWTHWLGSKSIDTTIIDFIHKTKAYQLRRGLWDDYLIWCESGLQLATEKDWRSEAALMLINIGSLFYTQGHLKGATSYYHRALLLYQHLEDIGGEALALGNIGNICLTAGDKQRAIVLFHQALPLYQQVDDKVGEATMLNNIGSVYRSLGQKQQAIYYYEKSLSISERSDNKEFTPTILSNLGMVYHSLNENKRALNYYERALLLAEQEGNASAEAMICGNIGAVYFSQNSISQALVNYHRALDLAVQLDDKVLLAGILDSVGTLSNKCGEKQMALKSYAMALPIFQKIGNRHNERNTHLKMFSIYIELGHLDKAEKDMCQVVEVDKAIEHPDLASDQETLLLIRTLSKSTAGKFIVQQALRNRK